MKIAMCVAAAAVVAGLVASAAFARPPARQAEAAELDLPLVRCTVQTVEPELRPDGSVLVSVGLPDGAATIELHPYSVRAAAFSVMERADAGPVPAPTPLETTYRGRVMEQPGARVVASVFDGRVTASIYLEGDTDPWCVQALREFDGHEDAAPSRHVVYRASDAIRLPAWCGVDDRLVIGEAPEEVGGAAPRGPGTACIRVSQVVFEIDFEFFQVYGSVPATVAGLEAYVNQVDFIYERDIGISIETVQVIIASSTPPAGHPYLTGSDPYAILGAFREYWGGQATPERDNVHLMGARDFGGIAGLAYLPGTCNTDGYNTGLTRRYTGDFNSIVVVLAHELGHNMGSPHDNQGGACANSPAGYVMNPFVSTSQMAFSPCSIATMNSFLWTWGGCLERVMPGVPFGRPDAGTGITGVAVPVEVLPNDISCESMSLQLVSPTSAGGAALAISPGTGWAGLDRVSYLANAATPANDTFQYRAVNANGPSAPITVTMTNLSPRAPENPASTQPALDVRYYALPSSVSVLPNFDALTPYATSTSAEIDYPSTSGPFADSGRADDIGAVYVGYLDAPSLGLYTLYIESDDGSRLKIGAATVVNNDGLHGMVEQSGQIALAPGKHALRVEFFERGGGAGLIMRWAGPGISKQVIPASRLSRGVPCPTDLDNSGATDVPDIFAFLSLWFAGHPSANWNGVGGVDVPDIFAFLSDWFAAAGPC